MRTKLSNALLRLTALVLWCAVLFPRCADADAPDWQLALPGWNYVFPADHLIHEHFKTEWWYFTGNLRDERGHDYGYELTFFRQGIVPPANGLAPALPPTATGRSRFVQNDFKFAHFAISDLSEKRFVYVQKMNRGAFGEAGFGRSVPPERLAWMENWSVRTQVDGSWRIVAQTDATPLLSIDLTVSPQKPPVIEGTDGVSQKGAGLGNASQYYSLTRLKTSGVLSIGDAKTAHMVSGESWFDHEWASNQLSLDQVGWNWFCIQFDDQTELMLYAMRRKDGSVDPVSSGTFIRADGSSEHLVNEQYRIRPVRSWLSRRTGAVYPVEWQVSIPSRDLDFSVKPRLDDQELALPSISYWEGATSIAGQGAGKPIHGVGYMELTGYAEPLAALQQAAEPRTDLRTSTH